MSLQEHLYSQHTVPNVLESYIQELNNRDKTSELYHANKLHSYKNLILDLSFLKELRDVFNEIYDLIDRLHPKLHFYIEGRRKSLISLEKKILNYMSMGKSLDLINDLFAFRLILFGNKDINLVAHCYKIAEEVIKFLIRKGFNPCEAAPLIGVNSVNPQYDFYENFEYKDFIKDYICFKKENGYQSIHIVFVDANGKKFEIQIRTSEMHVIAEQGEAYHKGYKDKTYSEISIPLERDKITVYGYHNEIIDFAGVEKAISIFQRQKTF